MFIQIGDYIFAKSEIVKVKIHGEDGELATITLRSGDWVTTPHNINFGSATRSIFLEMKKK